MKIVYVFAIGLIFFENIHTKEIVISEICETFHQRSYCILRLGKVIEQIQKNHKKRVCQNFCNEKFSNARVIGCIKSMYAQRDIQPFFDLWNDIKQYKYLNDTSLTHDFTKILFVLQHNMVSEAQATKNGPIFDMRLSLDGRSFTEATTVRNYYTHRLKKVLQFLKKIKCSKRSLFELGEKGCNCKFITHHIFNNKDIKMCINKMEAKQSVIPLILLGNDFASCKLIQDQTFLKEFVFVVFLTLHNIFENNRISTKSPTYKIASDLILHTYQNLEKLPLEEILEAIDLLHKELPSLLEKYEFNSKMKWKRWLKKYWWVPPTVIAIMGVRICWIFKNDTPPPTNPLLT